MDYTITSNQSTTQILFDSNLLNQLQIWENNYSKIVLVVDQQVAILHSDKFDHYPLCIIGANEANKVLHSVCEVIDFLLLNQVDKYDLIVGVGGGVITDLVGFVASVYKRGVPFAFVPTTILSMVDAAIGGKNGLNYKDIKNIIGVIEQPHYIVYDYAFLATLPHEEWVNGFAEIIKHACILSYELWILLHKHTILDFKKNPALLASIIATNVALKLSVVQNDVLEAGNRKILNFGHTLAHAIEIMYKVPHGSAVSIGMIFACTIASKLYDFKDEYSLKALLQKYELPIAIHLDVTTTLELLQHDKKKKNDQIQFVLLKTIGKASVEVVSLADLADYLTQFNNEAS